MSDAHLTEIGTPLAYFYGMNAKMKNSSKTQLRNGALIQRAQCGVVDQYVVTDVRNWFVVGYSLTTGNVVVIDNLEERGVHFTLIDKGEGDVLWTPERIAAYEALSEGERNVQNFRLMHGDLI